MKKFDNIKDATDYLKTVVVDKPQQKVNPPFSKKKSVIYCSSGYYSTNGRKPKLQP